jgi:hypothetical protein
MCVIDLLFISSRSTGGDFDLCLRHPDLACGAGGSAFTPVIHSSPEENK